VNWNFNGLEALAVFCGSISVLLILRRWWILRGLLRAASGSDSFPHIAWQYLKTPSLFWVLAASVQLGIEAFVVDPRWRNLAEDSIVGFVIFSIALMLNAMVQRGISRLPFAMAGLSRTLTRLIVFGIGLLILLRFWGSPSPPSSPPSASAASPSPSPSRTPLATSLPASTSSSKLPHLRRPVHPPVGRRGRHHHRHRLAHHPHPDPRRLHHHRPQQKPSPTAPSSTTTSPDPASAPGIPILLGHTANLTLAEKICVEAAKAHPQVLPDAEPLLVADPGITATHLQFRLVFQVEGQLGSSLIRSAILENHPPALP
jgi:hypothetical protein